MDASEWFSVVVGLTQGCVMSTWLFNVHMNGVLQEVNDRVLGNGRNCCGGSQKKLEIHLLLFVHDTALVADSEENLCQLVSEFGRECERSKL